MKTARASGVVSTPTLSRPTPQKSRRPGRKKQPLGASLKRFVDGASTDDLTEISAELGRALSHTSLKSWNDVKGSFTSPSIANIHSKSMAYLKDQKGGSGIDRRGSQNAEWGTLQPKNNMVSNQLFAAMNLAATTANIAQTNEGGSNMKEDDEAESEYYGPKLTSRGKSCAGKELISSMKMKAQDVLAELGNLDDSDSESSSVGDLGLGGLLREESLRGILREDSKYVGNWDREDYD